MFIYLDPPVVISPPHFYQGNKSLLKTVNGLNPTKSAHETFVDVEPVRKQNNIYHAGKVRKKFGCHIRDVHVLITVMENLPYVLEHFLGKADLAAKHCSF